MENKNKILELEENIEQSAQSLSGVFNLFELALSEMKRSFSSLFWVAGKQNEYFINLEMEKFERSWVRDYEEDLGNYQL